MTDIQTISIAIASASVVAGVIYYIFQIRHQNHMIQQQNKMIQQQTKMRQTDLVIRLYSAFYSTEFLDASMKFLALEFKDYKDYVNKYGSIYNIGEYGLRFGDSPELRAFLILDNFFNEVGILLHRGLIDVDLARDVFTYRVEMLWKKAEPLVLGLRKEANQPEAGKWFEYLHNELKKKEQAGVKNG
jgi:hypothetical protein